MFSRFLQIHRNNFPVERTSGEQRSSGNVTLFLQGEPLGLKPDLSSFRAQKTPLPRVLSAGRSGTLGSSQRGEQSPDDWDSLSVPCEEGEGG